MKIRDYLNEEFPNHDGRPGHVGGSKPKSSGDNSSAKRDFQGDIKRIARGLKTGKGDYESRLLKQALDWAEDEGHLEDYKSGKMGYDELKKKMMKLRFDANFKGPGRREKAGR